MLLKWAFASYDLLESCDDIPLQLLLFYSFRVALNVAYNSAALKQEENQFTAVPPSIADTLPRELRHLLGYS